jgi:hypothetical protein
MRRGSKELQKPGRGSQETRILLMVVECLFGFFLGPIFLFCMSNLSVSLMPRHSPARVSCVRDRLRGSRGRIGTKPSHLHAT